MNGFYGVRLRRTAHAAENSHPASRLTQVQRRCGLDRLGQALR
jgi:hypothetical protein